MQEVSEPKAVGIQRILKAFRYSCQGFAYSFKHEASFREEVLAALVLLPLALWLDVTVVERVLLVCSVLFVLIVELFNTAIEAVVDRIGLARHALAGAAKDVGSAAVLLSLVMWAVVWGSIIYARFF